MIIINLLIAIYEVLISAAWTIIVIVSILLSPIVGKHLIDISEKLFNYFPEPKYIKRPKMYCGPFYLPYFLRKIASRNFNMACKLHDERYNAQELSRKQIDKEFLLDMLHITEFKGSRFNAYLFYYLVRYVIGLPSWYIIKFLKLLGFKI